MKEKSECPMVKTGDKTERVRYDSAREALQASRVFNERFDKLSQIRYCPACECWHITTHGIQEPGIRIELETGSVFVSESVVFPKGIDELSREAEEAIDRVRSVRKYWDILEFDSKVLCRSSYRLRGLIELDLLGEKEKKYLLEEVEKKDSKGVKKLFDEIDNLLGDLKENTDYREKRNIRNRIKSLMNSESYVFFIFPDRKEEIKRQCFVL